LVTDSFTMWAIDRRLDKWLGYRARPLVELTGRSAQCSTYPEVIFVVVDDVEVSHL